MTIFGIPIRPLTKSLVQERILEMLRRTDGQGRRNIVTPNPEILLLTEDDETREALQDAALHLPDGIGLQWAAGFLRDIRLIALKSRLLAILIVFPWFLLSLVIFLVIPPFRRRYLSERITGVDTMRQIVGLCEQEKCSVFLLGSFVVEKTAKALKTIAPNINIVGTLEGSPKKEKDAEILRQIQQTEPDVLFVAFGAPEQELWIRRNLPKLPFIKIAMGVGGAFDMVSGTIKRAPTFFQKTGMEWLWRLFIEPTRIKRIFRATVRFPLRILHFSLYMCRLPYRKNVVSLVSDDRGNVLCMRAADTKYMKASSGAWMLPQEGVQEDEAPSTTSVRGLKEEFIIKGLESAEVKEIPGILHTYEWTKLSHMRWGSPAHVGQQQRGVVVRVPGNMPDVVPNDENEVDLVQWVPKDQALDLLSPYFHGQFIAFDRYLSSRSL